MAAVSSKHKLLDFGIAKLYAAVHGHDGDAMTRTGMIIGTPAYMAPEQVLGASEVSDRADVYAVGVVLFRLLSKRQPFETESPRQMMMTRLLDDPPSVRAFQPAVPESLAQLVDGCLAREAEQRPSAAELAVRLARWADAAGAPPLDRTMHARRDVAATMATSSGDDMSTY